MRPIFSPRIRSALTVVSIAIAAPAAATAAPPQHELAAALASAGAGPGGVGALVVDLSSGQVVYSQNADRAFLPASNEKLALTFVALVRLGPDYRMRTEVLGEGHLAGNGVWNGKLILKGYGDPTLDAHRLADLARLVRATGIRHVTGSLVADESFFDDRRGGPGWKPYFVRAESKPLSALVAGTADGAVDATRLFRSALTAAGVSIAGPTQRAHAGGFPLAVRWSPDLGEILRRMDVESDNFLAEMVLKQLGAVVAGAGTTAAGGRVVRATLAQQAIPLGGVRLADGSGLSAYDRLTAAALVTILQRIWADGQLREAVFHILPLAGRDGTLEQRMRQAPARGNVRAKTGTLDGVSALSGFVRERYAFSILQNAPRLSSTAARASQDRFATLLATP